ncbi:alpha/beta fold hydrolase [Pedobacter sp. HMF7647]|uniref:Alpha/beta fold hydrolase n=1 Tax=Hufsiella arboris TaxID=2695275 RepID=A0A7K1YAM9_9SPHI|nr:alpha/beta hydrolase [Hufsiella arboris]MXV51421.1 alpha/beta fold hydrolase [Hufsiella arboris]
MEFSVKEEDGFRYIDEGEGQVLLLLHGLMGALSNWEDVIIKFRTNYRVIIPMLPIYELPLLTTGIKSLAKFVHKFIKYKKLEQVTVLGNSLGGHVALVLATSHPEDIKAMVLAGSSGLYENSFGGSFPRRESYDFIKEKVEFTFYSPEIATKELVDEVFQTVNDRNRVIRILAMAKSAIRHNMSKDLYKITVPVCLIWGKNDKITPPEVAVEFHQLLPNSELNWIDQCGHAPMMEHPAEFNEYLEKFLNRVLLK